MVEVKDLELVEAEAEEVKDLALVEVREELKNHKQFLVDKQKLMVEI